MTLTTHQMRGPGRMPVGAEMHSGDAPLILVVDDYGPIRHLICRVLKMGGFRVLEAAGAHAALRIANSNDGPIALLLTDISMPGMNGNELIERFSGLHPDTPVIIMTADASSVRSVRHPILEKPFEPEALIRTITESLTGRGVLVP